MKERLLHEEALRFQAICDGDVAHLTRAMHPELVYAHTSGNAESRAQFIDALASGKRKYTVFDRIESSVRLCGDLAILHGTAKCLAVSKGVTKDFNIRYLSVLIHGDGQDGDEWRLLNWQSTIVP